MPSGLRVGNRLLVPNLGEPVDAGHDLTFAFLLQPMSSATLSAQADVLQNGQPMASTPIQLPRRDADGRISYTGTIPARTLVPGSYQLAISVSDGTTIATRDVTFRVAGRQP